MDERIISDPDGLARWLQDRSKSEAICLALRSASRVAPLWLQEQSLGWVNTRDKGGLKVCRALLSAAVALRFKTDEAVAAARKAQDRAPVHSVSSIVGPSRFGQLGNDPPGHMAAFAAMVVSFPEHAMEASVDAAEQFAKAGSYLWEQLRDDARQLQGGINLLERPLWSIPAPGWFNEAEREARAFWSDGHDYLEDEEGGILLTEDGSPIELEGASDGHAQMVWSFWLRWWDGFLSGDQLDWDVQHAVALIPDDDWSKGPDHIAALIAQIELDRALAASENAERVEVNPQTGRLHLVPQSSMPPDMGAYVRRKMAKARAVFPSGDLLAQHYLAIGPELDLLEEACHDAANLPVELFDACASVHRRVLHRAQQGECPSPELDPLIADFLDRLRDIGADVLANDEMAQEAISRRNAVLGNSALIDARGPLLAYANEVAGVSEGRLAQLPQLVEAATNPATLPDDRKAASFKLGGRVIRIITLVKSRGVAAIGIGGAFLTIEGLANSPWAQAALQAALRYFGFG